MKGGENMSVDSNTFAIKHLPKILQNADFKTANEGLHVVAKKYEEGIDYKHQFLEECQASSPDAYLSY